MRGGLYAESARKLGDQVQLAAVCDSAPERLAPWRDTGVRCYSEFDQLLEDKEVDAICLATPVELHARQAIQALRAGKHVLCEVPAVETLEESRELIRAVEETGLVYMLAENYCFMRDVLMVEEMVSRGVFGDLIYAEGSYLHDCRFLLYEEDGTLTWRGERKRTFFGNCYPTHSMGPVSRWLGINRRDWYTSLSAWQSGAFACAEYTRRKYGSDHELAAPSAWRMPDSVTTMLRSENGVLVSHRLDTTSPRPEHPNRYALQGTRAAFTSNIGPDLAPQIWIQDRSPTGRDGSAEAWEPLYKYAEEFEHPLWREFGAEAAAWGHEGSDFFVPREFVAAILEERRPFIDVYDAVTWSSITPLSRDSMEGGNKAVAFPRFDANQSSEKPIS